MPGSMSKVFVIECHGRADRSEKVGPANFVRPGAASDTEQRELGINCGLVGALYRSFGSRLFQNNSPTADIHPRIRSPHGSRHWRLSATGAFSYGAAVRGGPTSDPPASLQTAAKARCRSSLGPDELHQVVRTMRDDGAPVRPGAGTPAQCQRHEACKAECDPARIPSRPAVNVDRINGPDRRLHPTSARTSHHPLQCGSHPQRTRAPSAPAAHCAMGDWSG